MENNENKKEYSDLSQPVDSNVDTNNSSSNNEDPTQFSLSQEQKKKIKKVLKINPRGKRKKNKQMVRFRRLNWDIEYYYDLINGNGFQITEPAKVSLDGSKEKSLYGPESPLYGTSYEDEHSFIERYRCKCGEFKSRQFEGEICPICHTKVEFKDVDMSVTGWINLGTNRIINPYYFQILQKAIGKTVFSDIIYSKYKITTDGQIEKPNEEDFESPPTSPYSGIGVDEFFENYENILIYFRSIKKNKINTIDKLLKEKRSVFTSHIPIYSTMLRPQSVTSDTYYFGPLDKEVNTLFNLSENVKNCVEVERGYILQRIQKKVNKMWNINFNLLNGKEGFIRDQMLGGSLNFTSRNVIVPAPDLKDNEVDISYHTFLELFKYKIIYYLMKIDDIPLSKAYAIWKKSFIFNKKVYDIMEYINQKEKPRLLINRNPTLNYYSMLLMRIRKIKPTSEDYCLSVPLSILPGLNADFDGDILNIIALLDKSLIYMFRKFDPISRMIIDRDTGLLNNYFMIRKDQMIDLYYFCTIGKTENDQPEKD